MFRADLTGHLSDLDCRKCAINTLLVDMQRPETCVTNLNISGGLKMEAKDSIAKKRKIINFKWLVLLLCETNIRVNELNLH